MEYSYSVSVENPVRKPLAIWEGIISNRSVKKMCGCGMDSVGSELGPVAKVFCEYFNKF
jgi:hypothetical protein